MTKTTFCVCMVLCLLISVPPFSSAQSSGNISVLSINNFYFVDRYCTTPGVYDQSCFINALAAAPAGATLYVPPETYQLASAVTITKTVILQCASNAAVLQATYATGDILQINAGSGVLTGVTIRDCGISSTGSRSSGAAIHVTAGAGGGFQLLRLENLEISNQYIGLQMDTCLHCIIRSVQLNNSSYAGIKLRGLNASQWVADVTLDDVNITSGSRSLASLFIGSYTGGIYGHEVTLEGPDAMGYGHIFIENDAGGGYTTRPVNLFFDQLVVDNPGIRGMDIEDAQGVHFTNSWFASAAGPAASSGEGAKLDGGDDIHFVQCHILANNGTGIQFNGATDIWVQDSVIDGNSAGSPNLQPGIGVAANSTDFHIQGNEFYRDPTTKSQSYAVYILSGAANYTVVNNDDRGGLSGNIRDLGTGPKIVANNLP